MPVMVGSAKSFQGVPEPSNGTINRPLMVNAWSQTTGSDFSYLNEIQNLDKQSQREKELEKEVALLKENVKTYGELLTHIHVTSARTTALLSQQNYQNLPPQTQQYFNNSNTNSIYANTNTSIRTPQMNSKIVNNINPLQQVNCSPADSVKYTIIADGTNCHSDEPIEIELAEDDGALNLNSSADSGRLEICLASEENIKIKSEYSNANNNTMTVQQQITPMSTNHSSTPSEHHYIKRRKLAVAEQHEIKPNYVSDDEPTTSCNNSHPSHPKKKRQDSGDSLLKTPKILINNIQIQQSTPIQNFSPSPTSNNSNSLHHSFNNDSPHVAYDVGNAMITIGPNNTRVPKKVYDNINWKVSSIATRKLLMALFDRHILATHSMTGKPSPAFRDQNKPVKEMLDPLIIADIVYAVSHNCNVSDKEVRNAITTKCADENKMMKLQISNKNNPKKGKNKENIRG